MQPMPECASRKMYGSNVEKFRVTMLSGESAQFRYFKFFYLMLQMFEANIFLRDKGRVNKI